MLRHRNSKSMADYFSRVIGIVHQMRRNSENILEVLVMEKFLRSLIPKYKMVAITTEALKNLEQMSMEQLI